MKNTGRRMEEILCGQFICFSLPFLQSDQLASSFQIFPIPGGGFLCVFRTAPTFSGVRPTLSFGAPRNRQEYFSITDFLFYTYPQRKVACYHMVFTHSSKLRLLGFTYILTISASRMEFAAVWRCRRIGYIAS